MSLVPHRRRFVNGRAAAITAVAVSVGVVIGCSTTALATPCWSPPVSAPVADPFREPVCRWCPGNRGIEYRTRPGQLVVAVATGRVTFVGTVAGVRYLVVEHSDGRRVTYGHLATVRPSRGELVLRSRVVGTTTRSFHFGVRVGDRYVDPARSIGRLVGRPRLVPADGSRPAPAPAPRLSCRR